MRSPVALAIATALFVTGMPSAHAEVAPSTSPVVVWPADTTVGPDQPYEVGVTWSGTETLVAEVVTDAGTERVPLLVPDLPGTPTTTDVARGNGTGTVTILACAPGDAEDCTATFPDGEHTLRRRCVQAREVRKVDEIEFCEFSPYVTTWGVHEAADHGWAGNAWVTLGILACAI